MSTSTPNPDFSKRTDFTHLLDLVVPGLYKATLFSDGGESAVSPILAMGGAKIFSEGAGFDPLAFIDPTSAARELVRMAFPDKNHDPYVISRAERAAKTAFWAAHGESLSSGDPSLYSIGYAADHLESLAAESDERTAEACMTMVSLIDRVAESGDTASDMIEGVFAKENSEGILPERGSAVLVNGFPSVSREVGAFFGSYLRQSALKQHWARANAAQASI